MSGTRVYGVRHVRKIVVNKFPRKIESEFLVEITCKQETEEGMFWEINKTSPTISETNENDKSLALLKSLEDFTYPMTVKQILRAILFLWKTIKSGQKTGAPRQKT